MKKIIDGSLYNTQTAKKIGVYASHYNYSDLYWWQETLYISKSGKFFIHGEGNAGSQYGEKTGSNSWSGGETIKQVSPTQARKWAEERLDAEEYMAYFEEPEEASEEKVIVTVSVLKDTKRKLDSIRQETGQTISGIIDGLVADAK